MFSNVLFLSTFSSCYLPAFLFMLGSWLLGCLFWYWMNKGKFSSEIQQSKTRISALEADLDKSMKAKVSIEQDYNRLNTNYSSLKTNFSNLESDFSLAKSSSEI